MEAPPHNLTGLKGTANVLVHTFRGLLEAMPRQVRAVLEAKGRLAQYQASGYNVMADLCLINLKEATLSS